MCLQPLLCVQEREKERERDRTQGGVDGGPVSVTLLFFSEEVGDETHASGVVQQVDALDVSPAEVRAM